MLAFVLLDRAFAAARSFARELSAPSLDAPLLSEGPGSAEEPPWRPRPGSVEELGGRRAQALRALRELGAGGEALVTRERRAGGGRARGAELASDAHEWKTTRPDLLRVRWLPGCLLRPEALGSILLSRGWIEPRGTEPGAPAMRFYVISPAGRRALRAGEAWIESLGHWERVALDLFE